MSSKPFDTTNDLYYHYTGWHERSEILMIMTGDVPDIPVFELAIESSLVTISVRFVIHDE